MSMESTTYVAYYRVSTQRQGVSGLGLEAQHAAVEAYISQHGGTLLASYQEIESGGKANRPQLIAALEQCRLTKSTLVVAKLDRLTRDVGFLCRLRDSGVDFVATDNPEANRFTVTLMVAVAEEERRLISERTKAALAAAKRRGVRLGNPMGARAFGSSAGKGGPEAVKAKAMKFATRLSGIVMPLYEQGTSLRGIATALNAAHIPAPRGGEWRACSVRRVIARLRPAEAPEVAPEDLATGADAPEARAPGSCREVVEPEELMPETVAEREAPKTAEQASEVEPIAPETEPEPTPADATVPAMEPGAPKVMEEATVESEPQVAEPEEEEVDVESAMQQAQYRPEGFETLERCMKAVKWNGRALEDVPNEFRTPEVCLAAVRNAGIALLDVPKGLMTPTLCLAAVRRDGLALEWVPETLKTREICMVAFGQTILALQFVPDEFVTQAMCNEAVKQYGVALKYVPEEFKTPKLCLVAVKENGHALQWVPKPIRTRALCLAAIRGTPWGLEDLPDEEKTPELCMEAVKRDCGVLECIPMDMRTTELLRVVATKKRGRRGRKKQC